MVDVSHDQLAYYRPISLAAANAVFTMVSVYAYNEALHTRMSVIGFPMLSHDHKWVPFGSKSKVSVH